MDELLARSAPVTDDQLAHLDLGPAPRPLSAARRKRRMLAAGLGLSCAVALGAPAAAGVFSSHTGIFGNGGEDGHGEMLRLDAPDIRAVYERHQAEFPLPPGGTWDAFMARMTAPGREPTIQSESGIVGDLAFEATCQWERAWLDGEPTAQAMLDKIPTWPAIKAGDPSNGGPGGMPYALKQVADAARRGDAGPLKQQLKVNCS